MKQPKKILKKELKKYKNHFRVAIFGSARIKKNDPRYKQIYRLAKMIAVAGMDVVTGGGPGLMEAANKGHQKGRGYHHVHSFGLSIKLPHEQRVNKHLDIKQEFRRFSRRLDQFMVLSNVVVVAPGGIGTLLEFLYTWQLIQVEHICDTPIILLGDLWPDFVKWVEHWPLRRKMIDRNDLHPLFLANSAQEAFKMIQKVHEEYKKGGADFCKNFQKYKIK